jgi:hypothetical protein
LTQETLYGKVNAASSDRRRGLGRDRTINREGDTVKDRSPEKLWTFLPGYLVAGLTLGLADARLGQWVQQVGLRPGVATAASVNLLMPLLAIGLGAASRRVRTACLGAVGMTVAFTLGLAITYPQGHNWDVGTLVRSIPPVLVLACLGYAVIGTLTVLMTQAVWKRNGLEPHASRR